MNYSMISKSISILIQRLIHMCHKYGTNYYKVSKSNNKNLVLLIHVVDVAM